MTASQPHQPRQRVNYSQELRDNIGQLLAGLDEMKASQAKMEANQARLDAGQNTLCVQVATLPSRQEIAAEFDKRVSSVAYQSDRKALEDRIEKLEQSAQHTWAKAAVIVSTISVIVTVLVATHVF